MSEDDSPKRPHRRTGGRPIGETLGGILAGFDQQILRQQPPAHELVLKGSPVRGLSGDDPGDLAIVLGPPEVEEVREAEDAGDARGAGDDRRGVEAPG